MTFLETLTSPQMIRLYDTFGTLLVVGLGFIWFATRDEANPRSVKLSAVLFMLLALAAAAHTQVEDGIRKSPTQQQKEPDHE